MNITKRIKSLNGKENAIKDELIKYLLEQPQNPEWKTIGTGNIRTATVSSAVMFSHNMIMSPFYYDWREQASFLAEIVRNGRTLSGSLNKLQTVVDKGYLIVGPNTYVFAPEVRNRIKEVL